MSTQRGETLFFPCPHIFCSSAPNCPLVAAAAATAKGASTPGALENGNFLSVLRAEVTGGHANATALSCLSFGHLAPGAGAA